MRLTTHALTALLALTLPLSAQAVDPVTLADVPGSADHPVISRFTGSTLAGWGQQDWAATELPSATGAARGDRRQLADPVRAEGKLTQLFYLGPVGKTALEVFRNHQQALVAAGFKPRFSCELKACHDTYFALGKNARGRQMSWAKGSLMGARGSFKGREFPLVMALSPDEGRMLAGTLTRNGSTLELLLYTSLADNAYTDRAATYIEIVEPRSMQTGQVSVDANAIAAGLQADGRIALTGLFFDTGKAELKPESRPQLEAMAELLKAQPGLKAWIVGHTDNVGSVEANEKLSLARAQAVVAALTAPPYQVDGKRLAARGLAALAPVAGNGSEAGRAKNRRVELVAQ
ncbi:OmpA family protein [Pelomonas sp. UHG3]|uniref:OmpA family protein n=1 Tax=Roseateles hydrophilus TaxID=2975054 RepID=A0ACC6CC12_9BURK|nr:OmpA family protein [Pelomonas sp. UHG3]MCY4745879.1 OmpA family protein [Pelomonas sp. UHG3]